MSNHSAPPQASETAAVPTQDIPRRRKHTGLLIFLIISVLVLATLGITAFVNRETLSLLLHPERIEFNTLADTDALLHTLESEGAIRGLRIETDAEKTTFFFRSADGSVEINAQYHDDEFSFLEGFVNAMASSIQTIAQAEDFASKLLSPFLDSHETQAVILKFSPDIVAQSGRSVMDMSLTLGERYAATLQGPPMEIVRFTVEKLEE